MNLLTTPILYGLGAVAIAAGLFAGMQTVRLSHEKAAHATTKQHQAEVMADIANQTRVAAEKARAAEQASALALAAAGEQYERGKTDAQAEFRDLVAGLRAGVVRLQDRWQCPTAAAVPRVAAPAGQLDAGASDRAESAGRIVLAADECDAQVRGLQAVVKAIIYLTNPQKGVN